MAEAYDTVAEVYDTSHPDKKSCAEDWYIGRRLRSLISKGDRVVDLGCGTGLVIGLCNGNIEPGKYFGVDISEGMLAEAARKYPDHRFCRGDMEEVLAGLSAASYDVVVSTFGTLGYCRDFPTLFQNVSRVLRPGGRFLLMGCGPGYERRETYLLRGEGLLYTTLNDAMLNSLPQDGLRWRRYGMSHWIESFPDLLPQTVFNLFAWLETVTVGPILPEKCYTWVIEGEKVA